MVDMTQSVEQHARFFDHLVELIPPRFYYADAEERVDLHSMKKAARLAAKQEFKAKHKQNKRAKLDPDAPTAQQLQGAQVAHGVGTDEQKQQGAQTSKQQAAGFNVNLGHSTLSREELKAKLQRKIEAIRQQRGDQVDKQEKQAVAAQAKQWRQQQLTGGNAKQQAQQKQKQQQQPAAGAAGQQSTAGHKRKAAGSPDGEQQGGQRQPKAAPAAAAQPQPPQGPDSREQDFQFARLQFEDGRLGGGKVGGKKKPSKEQLLAAAEAKQAERQEAAASLDGQVQLVHEGWRAALARASGEKVLDDPKLLKKSLKKEAKRKEKSAKAWQERKAAQQEQKDKKQQRRTDNLQARVDQKIAKKKEKREKKLLGAGFEGRRTSFLGSGGGGGGAAPAKKA